MITHVVLMLKKAKPEYR